MLNMITHGVDTGARPLLIAHGLFGSARNWGVIAKRLSDERQVIAVDMRNHGDSDWTATHSYADLAADLAEVIEGTCGRAHVLGHSMGGKAAMMLALERPELVDRLTVADIAPVAYGHSQNQWIRAMRATDISGLAQRSEADARLAEHVPDAGLRAFLLQSLVLKDQRWKLNLDVLEAEMDKITGWPGHAGAFEGPALFLSGENSDYVTREHRPEIKRLFPAARFARLADTGHWLHAEKPRDFEAAQRAWMAQGEG